jgi:hypothetical protein
MNSFLQQLNLTPQERRFVLAIIFVLFIVVNYLLVWPHVGEWGSIQRQLEKTYRAIETNNMEIALDLDPTNGLKKQLARLEKLERQQGAAKVVESEVQLATTIHELAANNKVDIDKSQPVSSRGKTDEFFEEQSEQITIRSQEPQLINFLYQIGNDPSMIRVSELELHPADANRYKFGGTIVLTANYAKRPVVLSNPGKGPPPAGKPAPGTKPLPGVSPGGPPVPVRPSDAKPKPIPSNPITPPGQQPIRKNL